MREIEAFGVASVGSWFKRRPHDAPLPSHCANCGAALQGPWCHACGQAVADFHRSAFRLISESVQGMLHDDNRVWFTLPRLLARPGTLTRRYLDGHRAPQLPPFRLYVVMLVTFLFVFDLEGGADKAKAVKIKANVTPAEAVQAKQGLDEARKQLTAQLGPEAAKKFDNATADVRSKFDKAAKPPPPKQGPTVTVNATPPPASSAPEDARSDDERVFGMSKSDLGDVQAELGRQGGALNSYLAARLKAIKDHPEQFKMVLETWAQRLALVALPVSALMLGIIFLFRRGYVLFDHLVFSMHSLTFQLGLASAVVGLSAITGGLSWWLVWAAPVHLYKHMRGVYRTGRFGTLARMFVLFMMTSVAFSCLVLAGVWLGANDMVAH